MCAQINDINIKIIYKFENYSIKIKIKLVCNATTTFIHRRLLTTLIKIPQRNRFDSSLTTYYLLNEHKMSLQLFYVNSECIKNERQSFGHNYDSYNLKRSV